MFPTTMPLPLYVFMVVSLGNISGSDTLYIGLSHVVNSGLGFTTSAVPVG